MPDVMRTGRLSAGMARGEVGMATVRAMATMPTDAADGHDQEADDAECETEEKNVHCRAA